MSSGGGRVLAGCAVAFLLAGGALVAIVGLFAMAGHVADDGTSPGPRPAPDASPTPLPETYARRVDRIGSFHRADEPEGYRVSFGFVDHHGRRHQVTCRVGKAALLAEQETYGYAEDALQAEYNERLQDLVAQESARRGLSRYVSFVFHGWGAYRWRWQVPAGLPLAEDRRALREIEELSSWLKAGFLDEREEILRRLYARHGIRLRDDTLSIDYATVVDRARATTGDCFEALREAGRGSTLRQYLGLFVAFYQELTYELPPDPERGRRTLGLWTPGDVLVRGRGDCDSKSAAFAAMWRRMPTALLFIILPEHVLVAVEAPPWPGEHFVRLGNRHFLFSEVAGPGKSRPGFKAPPGNYEYVMFEPDRVRE